MFKNIFRSKRKIQIKNNTDFWDWFVEKESRFFKAVKSQRNIHKEFFSELSRSLGKLRNGFFYLSGMYDDQTAELVLTADGNAKNIVFVEELIEQAPQLDNWVFTALKQPALSLDETLEMNGYKFSSDNISFYEQPNPEKPDQINITFTHTELNDENRNDIITGIYLFIENYLGELKMLTIIDELNFENLKDSKQRVNSLDKLNDFLAWRQKEFIEKYDGVRKNTEYDNHGSFETTLENGLPLLAVINTDLLNWDSIQSHPWIMVVEVKYEGEQNGFPNKSTLQKLYNLENSILEDLKDENGYLFVGSQTSENIRALFFACREFRVPSKLIDKLIKSDQFEFEIDYEIYKDKYWQSFNRFRMGGS